MPPISTIRQYILVTLSNAEGKPTANAPECVKALMLQLFNCRSILVLEESKWNSYILHVGILNRNASKNTALKRIRQVFHEWEGNTLDVQFHKNWASICRYLLKQVGELIVWGEFSLDEIHAIAADASPKSASIRNSPPAEQGQLMETAPPDIIEKLKRCEDWYDIYDDPILRDLAVHSYESLKKIHSDLRTIQERRPLMFSDRAFSFLEREGKPDEYEFEELREIYLMLDWLACSLYFRRPGMSKQLLIYGVPESQIRLIFLLLSPVLRIKFTTYNQVEDALLQGGDYFDVCVVMDNYPEDMPFSGRYDKHFFAGSQKRGNLPLIRGSTSLKTSRRRSEKPT